MEVWRLEVSGLVQGVCFRSFVCHFVNENIPEVRGYVKNCMDGTVEVMGCGDIDDLRKLEQACRQGPPASRVDRIKIKKFDNSADFKSKLGDSFKISY